MSPFARRAALLGATLLASGCVSVNQLAVPSPVASVLADSAKTRWHPHWSTAVTTPTYRCNGGGFKGARIETNAWQHAVAIATLGVVAPMRVIPECAAPEDLPSEAPSAAPGSGTMWAAGSAWQGGPQGLQCNGRSLRTVATGTNVWYAIGRGALIGALAIKAGYWAIPAAVLTEPFAVVRVKWTCTPK